jgi:zinc protease
VKLCRFFVLAGLAAAPLRAAPVVKPLPNGLRVVVSVENGARRLGMVLMVRAGDADDPPGASGASRLLGRLLMQPLNHGKEAQWDESAFNGSISETTEPDVTSFSITTTPEQADAAVRRLALIIGEPIWNRTLVMRSVREEGEADREEPPDDWSHDFGVWQAKAGLPSPPPPEPAPPDGDVIERLFKRLYSPDRMTLAVAGDVSPDVAAALAEKYFTAPPSPTARFAQRRPRIVLPEPGTPTGRYAFVGVAAPPSTAPDAPAVEVLAAALGVGKTSGLFQQLREQDGKGYESGAVYPRRFTDSGVALYALAPDHAAAMRDDLLTVWRGAGVVPPGGWGPSRARAANAYAAQHQSARDRAYWLAFWELSGQGASHDAAFAASLRSVSDESLAAAAKRYFAAPPVSVP